MNTEIARCSCNPCPGRSCACGCQSPAAAPAAVPSHCACRTACGCDSAEQGCLCNAG